LTSRPPLSRRTRCGDCASAPIKPSRTPTRSHAERDEHVRVLLATFSGTLATHIAAKLHLLIGNRPRLRERLDIATLDALALRLYRARRGTGARIVDSAAVRDLLVKASEGPRAPRFSEAFLMSEWEQVVDAHGLRTWEAYRDVARLGRKMRLPESARERAWQAFSATLDQLSDRGLTTMATLYGALADDWGDSAHAPYDHVILDEAQDASAAQLRFLARLGGDRPNGLFFAGDLGQRIFQQPFSWLSVGVDVRGRARTLRVNYRTSHQIRTHADGLLDAHIDDVDGEAQDRRGTISAFDGPEPRIELFQDPAAECAAVAAWLCERVPAPT
jgi:superfamily I DNA/RNA helicase